MKQLTEIQGWGADKDPKDRPAYPKEKTPPNGTGAHWDQLEQQVPTVKVFHSIERPGLTPVFGTVQPPQGLSGLLRAYAFKFSEAQMAHWMTLLLADRVNVAEGMIEDVMSGRMPKLMRDGWKADLRLNKKIFASRALKSAAMIGGIACVAYLISARRRSPKFS